MPLRALADADEADSLALLRAIAGSGDATYSIALALPESGSGPKTRAADPS